MSGEDSLFVREATGLVRDWSSYDAWIYAFLSVNIVTLGFYIWTFNSFIPQGSPILATLMAIVILTLQNVVYAVLVSSMPRVGGDYVWQSRLLSGFWGMVLSWPGWVFALWLWVPIYGSILSWLVFSPLSALTGNIALANWWSSSMGLLTSSIIVTVFAFIYVSLGMKWYARIQKTLFYVGVVGMVLFLGGLLTANPESFQLAFNGFTQSMSGEITYQGILQGTSVNFAPMWNLNWWASFKLVPMLLFWIMWTVWGSTLFGEVREAGEFKKMFGVFEAALIGAGAFAIILWPIFDGAIGYEFYQSLNYNYFVGSGQLQWLSAPTFIAALTLGGGTLGKLMVVLMGGWFFAWSGTVFMSSTRVIFATSFDRTIPDVFAKVWGRYNTPIYAILVMVIPGLVLTVIYFFIPGFQTLTLDATFAIAITFFGTTIAAMLFPYRRPELFSNNPVSDWKVAGMPLVSIISAVYAVILLAIFYLWATKGVYGINNVKSAGFMVLLYIIATVIYFGMKQYRKSQGVDLSKIHSEIPKD